jgi:hypothetical protein
MPTRHRTFAFFGKYAMSGAEILFSPNFEKKGGVGTKPLSLSRTEEIQAQIQPTDLREILYI